MRDSDRTEYEDAISSALKHLPADSESHFRAFLAGMPDDYVLRLDHEDVAYQWQLLRDSGTLNDPPSGRAASADWEGLPYHGDIEEFWIGPHDPVNLVRQARKLDKEHQAIAYRVFIHESGRFMVCASYSRLRESSRRGERWLNPPDFNGEATLFAADYVPRNNVRVITNYLDRANMFRFACFNTDRHTMLRNLVETLSRHELELNWCEIWSDRSVREQKIRMGQRIVKDVHVGYVEVRREIDKTLGKSIRADLTRYLQARLRVESLFDIVGPRMVGPSSSHTAGANKIGNLARRILTGLRDAGDYEKLDELKIWLVSSFRDTGPGHGTHIALCAGLKGVPADDPDMKAKGDVKSARERGIEFPGYEQPIKFAGVDNVPFERDQSYVDQGCENVAEVVATVDGGREIRIVGYSRGGGLVEIRRLDGCELVPAIDGKKDLYLAGAPQRNGTIELLEKPGEGLAVIKGLTNDPPPNEQMETPFNTFEEVIERCTDNNDSILDQAIETERELQVRDRDATIEMMKESWRVMLAAIDKGLNKPPTGELLAAGGGDGARFMSWLNRSGTPSFTDLAAAMAIASNDVNASMGLIVACPTAGACGVLPGVLGAWHKLYGNGDNEDRIAEALVVAAFVGMIMYDDVPTAGAELGCQAEVGVGTAMAAAALAYLEWDRAGDDAGHAEQAETIIQAAILALKNTMGLVCDPVAGLVEVPCIKRNGVFASVAITAAHMALAGIRSSISPDEVVLAVREVGKDLLDKYKEKSTGGLATTRDGKEIDRKLKERIRQAL